MKLELIHVNPATGVLGRYEIRKDGSLEYCFSYADEERRIIKKQEAEEKYQWIKNGSKQEQEVILSEEI